MIGFERGQPPSFLLAFVLVLVACGTEPPPAEAAAQQSAPVAAAQGPAGLFGADPDGEEWFLSDEWMETTPCRASAEVVYLHTGLRMRGQRLEDQIQTFRARPDIGTFDAAARARYEALLEDVYATPAVELPDLGTRVAADCLAATPRVGVGRERALHCYRRHQEAHVQHIYRDRLPVQKNAEAADLDFKFHRCLRGDRS